MPKIGPGNWDSNNGNPHYSEIVKGWDDKGRSELLGFYVSYSESALFSLQFLYSNNGDVVISNPNTSGFTAPRFKQVTWNYPSEYLTSVTGSYSTGCGMARIVSITFGTNKATYGPFGVDKPQANTKAFSYEWGPRNDFNGFYGSYYSAQLTSLGVYIKTSLPLLPKREP